MRLVLFCYFFRIICLQQQTVGQPVCIYKVTRSLTCACDSCRHQCNALFHENTLKFFNCQNLQQHWVSASCQTMNEQNKGLNFFTEWINRNFAISLEVANSVNSRWLFAESLAKSSEAIFTLFVFNGHFCHKMAKMNLRFYEFVKEPFWKCSIGLRIQLIFQITIFASNKIERNELDLKRKIVGVSSHMFSIHKDWASWLSFLLFSCAVDVSSVVVSYKILGISGK